MNDTLLPFNKLMLQVAMWRIVVEDLSAMSLFSVTKWFASFGAKEATNLIPVGKFANHFKGTNKLVDNPANRALIQEISNGKALGVDVYGKSWYARTMPNGTQIYTYVQNGVVKGAGVNQTIVDIVARYKLKQ